MPSCVRAGNAIQENAVTCTGSQYTYTNCKLKSSSQETRPLVKFVTQIFLNANYRGTLGHPGVYNGYENVHIRCHRTSRVPASFATSYTADFSAPIFG